MSIRTIFRTIKRDTASLITNMTGFSIGLAASILLSVFIQYELSFDKHFTRSDRIFRMNSIWISEGERMVMPISLREAYTEIPEKVAGIETTVQLYRGFEREILHGENRYKGLRLLFSDPGFFRLFDLKATAGNLELALSNPYSIILTQDIARRIFGSDQALGESVKMDSLTYTVTAIVENVPPNTHFQFDMLMPMNSVQGIAQLRGLEFFTYYLLEKGADHPTVLNTICAENTRLLSERFASFENSTFDSNTESLERLHLHTSASMDLTPRGSMKNIFIMLIIAVAVMALALSNFINLYILNGAKRSSEIGIRKVNGATRKSLIFQFYMETTLVVTISFMAGVLLSLILIPDFGLVMERETFKAVTSTPGLYLILLAIYVFTILLSGLYPALLLSKSDPVSLILGEANPAVDRKTLVRIVNILQATVAIFLLCVLVGINAQTRFLKNLSPGYNPEGIVLIHNLNDRLTEDYPALHDRLLNVMGVEQVGASSHAIGTGPSGQGIRLQGDLPNQNRGIAEYRILPGLCNLYQFKLKHGRFLDPDRISDRNGVILNEAAARMLGTAPEALVGEYVVMNQDPLEVIGIVEDFLYQSAAREVGPLILTAYSDRIRTLAVRTTPGADIQGTINRINDTMKSFDESYILVHRFAKDLYEGYYQQEERLRSIVGAGSVLSIIIVLLGIYALVSHNIVSRTKEIAIRKVMGGSTSNMLALIYVSTLQWTLIASIIATPLSWLYLRQWLNDYAVRIPLYWWIFFGSIVLIMLFETAITLGQTWKAARRNPVDGLRYE